MVAASLAKLPLLNCPWTGQVIYYNIITMKYDGTLQDTTIDKIYHDILHYVLLQSVQRVSPGEWLNAAETPRKD